ncbi:hypothetical protein Q0Z83_059860 [Actinoplanes sichuanensis]|uniref:Uncharacterized protein n=1 Tax=Actinoplanes sichuanensis TaxID=512349 RepID=A0ABW4A845_9ACTN|nr:hypothetical protein [Actinoplanes sichuanensis]BEL07795.1 hypothetical protein Q0Z83_059860 [Actinoplanes sichuanensis]
MGLFGKPTAAQKRRRDAEYNAWATATNAQLDEELRGIEDAHAKYDQAQQRKNKR